MELLEKDLSRFKNFKGLFLIVILLPCFVWGEVSRDIPQPGLLMFQIQQGEPERALRLYQQAYASLGEHDYELLHQMALALLDYGFHQKDPESQLFALFGAGISAHEDVYYILEESTKSAYEPIQLIALQALAKFQTEQADILLMHALGSPSLSVRFEAVKLLCKKKHPQAVSQAESLLYKSPKAFWPLYPPLFAMVGDAPSTRILRKLLNHPSHGVHLSALLSIAKYNRDDLIPQIRQLSAQLNHAQQEACAFALGHLHDDESIPRLEKMAAASYPTSALAAQIALCHLGKDQALADIEESAEKGDLYAIAALGEFPEHPQVLLALLNHPHLQVRTNALIALVRQQHPKGLERVGELILRNKKDFAFAIQKSPGHTLKALKVISSSSQVLKDDIGAFVENLELKESLLEEVRLQSQESFIDIAHQIYNLQQNELVPLATKLLEDLATEEAILCLKQHQQQLGAPFIRNYCNLALYRLKEPGAYGEQLAQWVKQQTQAQLIQFKPFDPWKMGQDKYVLTPVETSQLLIEAVQAFAENQDTLGVEALIDAIATGHPKNRYALAGLLLRATQ